MKTESIFLYVSIMLSFFLIPINAMESADSWPNAWFTGPHQDANPVYHLARYGNADQIRFIHSNDINQKDSKGYNVLHYACYSGDLNTVQKLVENFSADVNAKNVQGKLRFMVRKWKGRIETPLHSAVLSKKRDIVEFLLDKGAEIDSDYQEDGSTPLHLAAWFNAPDIAQLLIDRKADVKKPNLCGSSPVHCAAWRNSVEVLEILLNSGVDFTGRNCTGNGNTPLYLAAKIGSVECLKILLARDRFRKETINLVCSGEGDDYTSLEVALVRFNYQCFWDLLRAGADVSCLDKERNIKSLKTRPTFNMFLKDVINAHPYGSFFFTLNKIRLDEQYTSCDICLKNYQNNEVVFCLYEHELYDAHTFHEACFWNAGWKSYYKQKKDKDNFFGKNKPEEESQFLAKLYFLEEDIFKYLSVCPKEGCNANLSSIAQKNRMMKIYNPSLEQ